jgi:hypothetical protein
MAGEPKFADEPRVRRAFHAILLELLRMRKSLAHLYKFALQQRREILKLEKRISSFIEPN